MNTTKVAGVEVSTAHFIDGKRAASKRTFQVYSPIDGKHLADVSAGGAGEIDAAVAAARRAFPALPRSEPRAAIRFSSASRRRFGVASKSSRRSRPRTTVHC